MPLDAAKLEELKTSIAFARKRPLAFGLCLGKAPETTVLLSHKTKDPETVGRLAKKEGETTKIAFGMMTVEAKNLNLLCHGDIVPGLARKTKEMLKAAGLKMKVRILDAEGNLLEDDGEEDEDGGPDVAVGPGPDTPTDPQKEKWTQTRPRVEEALAKAGADPKYDLTQARATWATALTKAETEDFAGAMQGAADTVKQISAAVEAARAADGLRESWLAEAAKLGPAIGALGQSAAPEVKKILAYWAFAQAKATGPVPDFGASVKTAGTLVKMIAEYRTRHAQEERAREREAAVTARGTPPEHFVNGAPPVNATENERLGKMSDEDLAKADLTLGDPKVLFGKDYMLKLKDMKFKGEDNPNLKALMREVDKGLAKPREAVVMPLLSQLVGSPPTADELRDDHGRFVILRKQQEAIAKQKKKGDEDNSVPPLDEGKHPDFMASRGQLMFGKVLGDAFGIHEIFAALLSPTGGLVGAGNDSVHLDASNPIAIHGTVHDAAGYLSTYHSDGPGYNYLEDDREYLVFDNLPLPDYLAGQFSGISFWVKEAGQGKDMQYWIKATAEEALRQKANEVLRDVEKKLKPVRDAVQAEIDLRVAQAKRKAKELEREAEKKAKEAEKLALDVIDAIEDAGAKVRKGAVDTLEDAAKGLEKASEEARKKLESAWDAIWS